MVSTRSLISKFSSPCINRLVTLLSAPITIGIIVTFMFNSFFSFSRHFLSILLCGLPGQQNSQLGKFSSFFFLLTITRSGRLAEIRWSICISISQSSLCVSVSRSDYGMCIYHFFAWSNSNFLHNSQWIILPNQSCLVLYSFWASLLHSLIMWWIVLSLSPHNPHLLFCCFLSIFALI